MLWRLHLLHSSYTILSCSSCHNYSRPRVIIHRIEPHTIQQQKKNNNIMESWLGEVKQLRIPRPKFGCGQPRTGCYPIEPPRDYYTSEDYGSATAPSATSSASVTTSVSRKSVAPTLDAEKLRQQNLWAWGEQQHHAVVWQQLSNSPFLVILWLCICTPLSL